LVLLPLFLLVLFVTDGLGEELAWRGFALPRLLTTYNALVASLILGVLGGMAPPAGVDGGSPALPTALLAAPLRHDSQVGPVHLGVLAHARERATGRALARHHQPFVASPVIAEGAGVALLLLAALAKWVLVGVVIAVAGPGLAKGPRPEALPKTH
jgi:hypothetical protein